MQGELDALVMERQSVIHMARKDKLTEDDMELQLGELGMQELYLKREMAKVSSVADLSSLDSWEIRARAHLEGLREGVEMLNAAPAQSRKRREQSRIKRGIVEALVNRVDITGGKERELTVEIRLDVLALLDAPDRECEIQSDGICTDRFDLTPLRAVLVTL